MLETTTTWFDTVIDWITSRDGSAILTTVVLPFAAILVAGVLAALIARGSSKRLLKHRDAEAKAASIAGLLAVGRRLTMWAGLGGAERDHLDHQMGEAIIRLRLLPIAGADLAAEWTQLKVQGIKRDSAAFIDEAERGLADLSDALVLWHRKPRRGVKQFKRELQYLRADAATIDRDLAARQRQWQAAQEGTVSAFPATASEPASVEPTPEVPGFTASELDELISGETRRKAS